MTLRSILDADFRANLRYEPVQFERLHAEQIDALGEIPKDPELYGILRPREGAVLPVKSVCRDTARLFIRLQAPGRIPEDVRNEFGERCNQAIAELVLDGVLEIESEGAFVCGSQAAARLYDDESEYVARGLLARLSLEALRYAQSLDIDDGMKLSARLYFYNRVPVSPRWMEEYPSAEAVAAHLGLNDGSLGRFDWDWFVVPSAPPFDGWVSWQSKSARTPLRAKATYKLYVSPQCDYIKDTFREVVAALPESRARGFKIGRDVYGLLRPDKMVVYFETLEGLHETAEILTRRLGGCPAQGVPFSAQIGDGGLLSWGVDPPAEERSMAGPERESWRLWLTNRLATALLTAKRERVPGTEPWRFALERLRLEGVDMETWTPDDALWGGAR